MLPAELIALEDRYGAHNYDPLDVVIERASGAWVYDTEGRRYLDFLAAYSAVNQGHCHPTIFQAMCRQAEKVTLTSRAFRNDQLPLLYRDLHELTGYEMALPMNSGAEGVETALKAARKWGDRGEGHPRRAAGDCCRREQLSRAHHRHRRLLVRRAVSQGVWSFSRGISRSGLRRRRGAAPLHYAKDLRFSGRTHPGRGGHHHPA